MKRYRFQHAWRQFKPGDFVPDEYDHGIKETLLATRRVEVVEEPEAPPAADESPAPAPKRSGQKGRVPA